MHRFAEGALTIGIQKRCPALSVATLARSDAQVSRRRA
jgi:hypothetical protein